MASYLIIVLLFWAVGCLLTLGAYFILKSSGKFFLASGAVASISGYIFIILSNGQYPFLQILIFQLLIGILVSLLILRVGTITNPFEFILASLAIMEIVKRLEFHFSNITGGAYGIRLTSIVYDSINLKIILILITLLIIFAVVFINKLKIGQYTDIAGSNPLSAQNMGINIKKVFNFSIIITGLICSFSGLFYAVGYGYIHPDDFSSDFGLMALAAALSLRGKYFGIRLITTTFILFAFREILRIFEFGGAIRFGIYDLILGVFLVALSIKLASKKK